MVVDHDVIAYHTKYSEGHFYVLDGKSVDVVKVS